MKLYKKQQLILNICWDIQTLGCRRTMLTKRNLNLFPKYSVSYFNFYNVIMKFFSSLPKKSACCLQWLHNEYLIAMKGKGKRGVRKYTYIFLRSILIFFNHPHKLFSNKKTLKEDGEYSVNFSRSYLNKKINIKKKLFLAEIEENLLCFCCFLY